MGGNVEAARYVKGFNPLNSFIVVVSKTYVTVINAHETRDYLTSIEALDYVLSNAGKGHKGGHFEVAGRGDDAIEHYKAVVALFDKNAKIRVTGRALCSFQFRVVVKPYLSERWFQNLLSDGFFDMNFERQITYAYDHLSNAEVVRQFFLAYEAELIDVRKQHLRDPRWLELKKASEKI